MGTTITITFDGVYVHMQRGANPPLPASYRVAAPISTADVRYENQDLGSFTPTVTLGGQTLSGPLVLTISSSSPQPTPLPPDSAVPHLSSLVDGFSPDPAIAYAAFPPDAGIFLNLANIPGSWPMDSGQTVLTFVSEELDDLAITMQTAPGGPQLPLSLTGTTIAFSNLPNPAVTPNNPETLLGFLALASSIPPGAVPPPDAPPPAIGMDLWIDPSLPGCSNSQWP